MVSLDIHNSMFPLVSDSVVSCNKKLPDFSGCHLPIVDLLKNGFWKGQDHQTTFKAANMRYD